MRGLFPGRFQPFHLGHREFVERILSEVDEVVVGVGSAQASHTGRNPFTAGERVAMIHRALAPVGATTYVVPIEDLGRYALWPAHAESLCPPFDVVYTNNPLVDRVCSEAGIDTRGVDPIDRDRYRGTEIRRRIVAEDEWRDLVPDPVIEVIAEIDGVRRLRRVTQHDGHAVDE
jgi:nicotinamide-nucleotide adenylyltransferase